MIKYITNIKLDTSDIPQVETTRNFTIVGEDDAVFSLYVMSNQNGAITYFNFKDKSWDSDFKSENKLSNIKLQGGSYNSSITFKAISSNAATYSLFFQAEPHYNTELDTGFFTDKLLYRTDIDQVLDTKLTFGIKVGGQESYYVTNSIDDAVIKVESTGTPIRGNPVTLTPSSFTWEPTNTTTDMTKAFGLILASEPTEYDFVFRDQGTTVGDIDSSTSVEMADLENLCVGMTIVGVSSGSLSGNPTITAIDKSTNILTLSSAQDFGNGITLTFQARGSDVISKAISADLSFSVEAEYKEQLTTTIRSDVSSSTVLTVNGNLGVNARHDGGVGTTIRGVDVNNSSTNRVVATRTSSGDATASDSGGELVVEVAQTLKAGTKIYIDGCAKTIVLKPTIKIKKYPIRDSTIYFNISRFVSLGANLPG